MRAWKKAKLPAERVFVYFADHHDKFFTEDHIAAQVGVGRRRVRKIVAFLVAENKLETIETVSAPAWGRPKLMFRAIRSNASADSIRQLEIFRDSRAGEKFGELFS